MVCSSLNLKKDSDNLRLLLKNPRELSFAHDTLINAESVNVLLRAPLYLSGQRRKIEKYKKNFLSFIILFKKKIRNFLIRNF